MSPFWSPKDVISFFFGKNRMINAGVSFRSGFNVNRKGFTGTVTVNPGELKLRASVSEATLACGSAFDFSGLLLSVDKPGSFVVDYDVPKKDLRFQFMNSFKLIDKEINFTYTQAWHENQMILDGTLVLNAANKLSLNCALDTGSCKLTYRYVRRGLATLEPSYDFTKNSWDLAVYRTVLEAVVRASYETSSQVLGLDCSRQSLLNNDGEFKISAAFDLSQGLRMPKLKVESSWNYEV